MKTVRKLALYCTLTLALGAFAFGPFAFTNVSGLNQVADTSGQPNEWDVGSIGTPTLIHLADTSGQPNEWDVG